MKTIETPWGQSQSVKEIGPGVLCVDTQGHGGYYVTPGKLAEAPAGLRKITSPYSGGGWYEEDCDWALVALMFPDLFSEQSCFNAVRTVQGSTDYGPMMLGAAWLRENPAALVLSKAARFGAIAAGKWEIGCQGSPPDGLAGIWATFLLNGQRQDRLFKTWPNHQFYTQSELDAASVPLVRAGDR
jgi:hypothetical protein